MLPERSKCIETAREDGILVMTIANPPHNYLPSAFFRELDLYRELTMSPDVRAIVITGTGNSFSKGADVKDMITGASPLTLEFLVSANDLFTFISRLEKPVVAAINGACLGGGLELALACHVRTCSEKALLGLPEVSVGLIPGLGGIERLISVVGTAKALEMILLGDMVSSEEALKLGLVSRVFPKKDFLAHVLRFVKTMVAARSEAIAEVLRLTGLNRRHGEDERIRAAAHGFLKMLSGIKPT